MANNQQLSITRCKKAELYTHDGRLIVEAPVNATSSTLQIVLPQTVFAGIEQPECLVRFFDGKHGLVDCQCCLARSFATNDEQQRWQCQILQIVKTNNRRNDLKVPTDLKIRVLMRTQSNQPPSPQGFNAKLINLSTGGAYISSFMLFNQDDSLTLHLPVDDDPPLMVTATIVRPVENLEPEGGCMMYGYGCQFNNLSVEGESRLRKFVFAEQLKARKEFQIA